MLTTNRREGLRAALYARVSTNNGQDPEVQLRELRVFADRRGWTIAGEYVDKGVSGAKDRRPALDRLIEDARRRRIDVVVVWALDRLGRSLRHLVNLAAEFETLGVDLACFTQAIDTTTPAGRLTFQVLSACAEFEREMIKERVRAGVAKAKANGKKLGRPATALDLDTVRARLASGESLRRIAKALDVHHATLSRTLARSGAETTHAAPLATAS